MGNWNKCQRCGGSKKVDYRNACDECRYEDEARKMMRELEKFLETGEIPAETTTNGNLPRPFKEGPPKDRWQRPELPNESA